MLVVIAIIGILASMLLPGIARSRDSARRVFCANQLRQTGLALKLYAGDHAEAFPPRLILNAWPNQMKAYLRAAGILTCPADRSATTSTNNSAQGEIGPRSFIMNGFDDLYKESQNEEEWRRFPKTTYVVREEQIPHPMDTIAFGEKSSDSAAFHLDLLLDPDNYFNALNESRHGASGHAGESNYAWIDGSVHSLKFGKDTCPINLWAALDNWRTQAALCRPR
jgi:prepilin-type processing-associated H-X9-DG protein